MIYATGLDGGGRFTGGIGISDSYRATCLPPVNPDEA
jgi:hypothetical protein